MTNINDGDCRFYNSLSFSVVKFFLNLFYIRLPSNVEYFTVTHSNQAYVLNKAQNINAVNCLYSYKDQRIFYSMIISIDENH